MAALIARIRARVAQFAASHPTVYAIGAIVFAVLVGVEVYSMTSFDAASTATTEHPDSTPIVEPLGPDERGLALPHSFGVPDVEMGDAVEVAIQTDLLVTESGRMIGPARVLSVGDAATLVAVPAEAVLDIVGALSTGSVALVGAPDSTD